jgi:hypothetical protein
VKSEGAAVCEHTYLTERLFQGKIEVANECCFVGFRCAQGLNVDCRKPTMLENKAR